MRYFVTPERKNFCIDLCPCAEVIGYLSHYERFVLGKDLQFLLSLLLQFGGFTEVYRYVIRPWR